MANDIELFSLGKYGIIQDVHGYLLPPEAWTAGQNVRFTKNGVLRMSGHSQVFGTLFGDAAEVPEFIMNVPGVGESFWIYASLDEVSVYEGGVHTDITGVSGPYNAVNGRDINGTILGGIPIINNGVDDPQYWTLDVGDNLADLTAWPANFTAKQLIAFGSYLVALNLTDAGVILANAIQWSHKAEPGTLPSSWDYTDPAVDAGRLELTDAKGGEIKWAALLGDELIIYKNRSTHSLRFVVGNEIFRPTLLLTNSGVLAQRCACAYDKGRGHFVVTEDDIIVHSGTKDAMSIVDEINKDFIFNNLDPTNFLNAYVFDNPRTKECFFCFPTVGNTYPDLAAVWSYRERGQNKWSFRPWNGVSTDFGTITDSTGTVWDDATYTWDSVTAEQPWARESQNVGVFVDRTAKMAFRLDTGFAYGSTTPTAFVERIGLSIDGKDRDGSPKGSFNTLKQCVRLWPKISSTVPITVLMGSQQTMDPSEAVVWSTKTWNPGDKYLDFVVVGRLLAVRYEWTANVPVTISGQTFEINVLAKI